MPREWGGQCAMDTIDPLDSNGCQGAHRSRPWHWALGYCTKAGRYHENFGPMRAPGDTPWSGKRARDGQVRVCEAHAERLERYRGHIDCPRGGRATPAAELAIVADAIRVRAGHPRQPYDTLIATTSLPRGLPCDFDYEEEEWIVSMRRRCTRLEARNAELEAQVLRLEVEWVLSQLVAEVASQVAETGATSD